MALCFIPLIQSPSPPSSPLPCMATTLTPMLDWTPDSQRWDLDSSIWPYPQDSASVSCTKRHCGAGASFLTIPKHAGSRFPLRVIEQRPARLHVCRADVVCLGPRARLSIQFSSPVCRVMV